jgi:hypothetical protein
MAVALTKQIFKLEKKVSELLKELESYKKGYAILIEQWNCLPDDVKETTHKKLQKENL